MWCVLTALDITLWIIFKTALRYQKIAKNPIKDFLTRANKMSQKTLISDTKYVINTVCWLVKLCGEKSFLEAFPKKEGLKIQSYQVITLIYKKVFKWTSR